MATTTTELPPLVGILELARMTGVRPNTAYHWRADTLTGKAKDPLPEPAQLVSGSPVWLESQLIEWAEAAGKTLIPNWRESAG